MTSNPSPTTIISQYLQFLVFPRHSLASPSARASITAHGRKWTLSGSLSFIYLLVAIVIDTLFFSHTLSVAQICGGRVPAGGGRQ